MSTSPHFHVAVCGGWILRVRWLACGLKLGVSLWAAAEPDPATLRMNVDASRLTAIFQPYRTEHAALSPDGRYLAYSLREGETLSVAVVEIDHPETMKTRVQVATDASSSPAMAVGSSERTPAEIRWMRWVTPTRLVVETNRNFPVQSGEQWSNRVGAIMAFDADGTNAKTLVTPEDVARVALDFAAFAKPDQPVFEAAKSVDQPTVEPVVGEVATLTSTATAAGTGSVRNVRSPRIHDFLAGEPECVLVRTEGDQHVGRYKLNVVTGVLTSLSDEVLDLSKTPLYDRQGLPRGATPANVRVAFPHVYAVETGRGLLRWKSLDEIAAIPTGSPGFHVAPENFFGERAVPVGFGENPDTLYYASNVGRDTYGIYSLNLKNGQRQGFSFENAHIDLVQPTPGGFVRGQPLVFDRFTRELAGVRFESWWRTARWLRPNLQAVQAKLEQTLPGRSVDILEWDRAEQRFLVLTRGPVDPGTFYIFDAAKPRLAEFVRRAPAEETDRPGQAAVLSFNDKGGRSLGALLTLPGEARPKPVALVVLAPSEPWGRVRTDHRAEVQALTEMGLAVLQINGRGAFGFGVKQREALKPGYEESQVEDMLSALDYLQKYLPMNFKRVIAMGADWGGFVALRAVQLHPERFRCAVTLNPTVDPGDWLANSDWTEGAPGPALTRAYYGDATRLKIAPLMRKPGAVKNPVLVLSYPGAAGTALTPKYLVAKRFAAAVRAAGGTTEFADLTDDFIRGYPQARAETYGRIQQFLNDALFTFDVKVGEAKVVSP